MAQQTIGIGAAPNDGTGDPIRDAFDKCNDNFTELYTGLTGLLDFKGSTDCSANPNYPAASKGDYYLVSVAGKIGGASGIDVQVGDSYFAIADNAGGTQAGVGTSWTVMQGNLVVDNDTSLTADSTTSVPTQHAVKTYVDGAVAGGGVAALDDVGDVNAPTPSNGDVLTWDSTPGEWVNAAPTGGSNALDDLTDVTAPTPSDGDVLTFDSGSGDWINSAPTGGGDLGVFHAYEEKASGTDGGSSVAAFTSRMLNTVKLNTITSAAQITSTVTMTIASPCVVTWTSHGLANGEAVQFVTSGALPTGLSASVTYYVVSTAANTFSVATTPGGAAINTSGSQSGTHTAYTGLISLPAGTYEIIASAPVYPAGTGTGFKSRLYNVTDAATTLEGSSAWSNAQTELRTWVQGRFTIAGTKTVRLETTSTAVRASGFGVNAAITSVNNHFSDVFITQIA